MCTYSDYVYICMYRSYVHNTYNFLLAKIDPLEQGSGGKFMHKDSFVLRVILSDFST
jgi:hypothetical protein